MSLYSSSWERGSRLLPEGALVEGGGRLGFMSEGDPSGPSERGERGGLGFVPGWALMGSWGGGVSFSVGGLYRLAGARIELASCSIL